jgi:tetratricopeptide (TPR) repeat protein
MEAELDNDPTNWQLIFALSRIAYYLKDYPESVRLFNSIESQISFRTLWYQLEPLQAIEATGDYQRVFAITNQIINNQNRAYSELYYMRGTIYEKQGMLSQAKKEYEQAVLYNNKNPLFQKALSHLP